MKNDLHIRTNFSASADKKLDYITVLKACQKAKLDRISITDFDTCVFHCINKILDTSSLFSGQIISGMECDACENGITFELLAYNFEPIKTFAWSYDTYGTLETRQTKIKDILLQAVDKAGLSVNTSSPFNGKVDFAHKYVYENMLGFEQNVDFFKHFNITNLTDFYNASTKDNNFPLYIDMCKVWPDTKTITNFIHSVGGIVVLAQPLKSKNRENIEFLLNNALKNGVDGIEVYHPAHTKEDIKFLLDFAHKHNLIITGGSNFNGKEPTNKLGIELKNQEEILKLK